MESEQQFEQAVTDSETLSERPSIDVRLELNALYKQTTIGDVNIDLPSPLNFSETANYNAWTWLASTTRGNSH